MEISQLRYLVTIAEEQGFTQAARKLRLSQPSLSLAIKKLEEEIGQPLFDRLTRKVLPTEAGERMIEMAQRILSDIDRTSHEIRDMKGGVTGVLRVGAIPTISPFALPAILQAFCSTYPAVDVQVTENVTSHILELLEQGEIDVALVSTIPDRPGIHTDLAANENLVAIVNADHRLAGERQIDSAELENERFLLLSDEHCLTSQVSWFCRKNRIAGNTRLEGTQLATIAALVSHGLGVSLVPASMAEVSTREGCRFLPVVNPTPSRPLHIAWSVLRYRTQAGREFARIAKDILAASAGSTNDDLVKTA